MARRKPKRSKQSNAISRPDGERGRLAPPVTGRPESPPPAPSSPLRVRGFLAKPRVATQLPASRERAGWRFAGASCQCLADPAGIEDSDDVRMSCARPLRYSDSATHPASRDMAAEGMLDLLTGRQLDQYTSNSEFADKGLSFGVPPCAANNPTSL